MLRNLYDSATKKKVFSLLKAGKTPREVSEKLEIPKSTICTWIRARANEQGKRDSQDEETDSDSSSTPRLSQKRKLEVVKNIRQGKSIESIAVEHGVTRQTVKMWIKRDGVFKEAVTEAAENNTGSKPKTTTRNWEEASPRHLSTKVKYDAVQRARRGESYETIAEDLGVSRSSIIYWRAHASRLFKGLYKNSYDLKTKFEAIQRIRNGESRLLVAKSLGASVSIIYKWCKDENVKSEKAKEKAKREATQRQQETANKDVPIRHDVSKKRQAMDLLKSGSNPVEVARQLNLPLYSVVAWQKNKKTGLETTKKAFYSLETKLRAIQLYKEGKLLPQISKLVKAPVQSVAYWVKRSEALKKLASTSPTLSQELKKSILEKKGDENKKGFVDAGTKRKYSTQLKRTAVSLVKLGGKKPKEVCTFLNIPYGTFDHWIRDKTLDDETAQSSLELPTVTQPTKVDSIRLIRRGVSLEKISKDLGVSPSTVSSWMKDELLLKRLSTYSRKPGNRTLVKNPLGVRMFPREFTDDILVAVLQDFGFDETEILGWIDRRRKPLETLPNNNGKSNKITNNKSPELKKAPSLPSEKRKSSVLNPVHLPNNNSNCSDLKPVQSANYMVDPFSDDDCADELGKIFSAKCKSDVSDSEVAENGLTDENGELSDKDYSYVTYEEALKMCKTD